MATQTKTKGLPTMGPQVPDWYGSQQQQTFPTPPAYTRTTSQPNAAVSGLSRLLDMFSGAGNRARLGMRQNLNYNNLPGRTPPHGTPDYNLPRVSQERVAIPQPSTQIGWPAVSRPVNQYATPAGPPSPTGYALPAANGLPQSFTEGVLQAQLRAIEQAKQQWQPTESQYQKDRAAMLAEEDIRNANRQTQTDMRAMLGGPGRLPTGAPAEGWSNQNFRDLWNANQGINTALQQQSAIRGALGPGPSGGPQTPAEAVRWARDAAAQGNMNQGTPWQPVPGTVGLPAFVSQAERDAAEFEAMDRAKAAEAQRFADFTAKMKPNASYYEGMGRGRPQPSFKEAKKNPASGAAAVAKRAAETKPQREAKRVASRAANYGRSRGLPPAVAQAGIQGMDMLAKNPQAMLTDIQRRGVVLPPLPPAELNQAFIAHANMAQEGVAKAGWTPEQATEFMKTAPPLYVRPGTGGPTAPTLPTTPPPVDTKAEASAYASGQAGQFQNATRANSVINSLNIPDAGKNQLQQAHGRGDLSTIRNLLTGYYSNEAERRRVFSEIVGIDWDSAGNPDYSGYWASGPYTFSAGG